MKKPIEKGSPDPLGHCKDCFHYSKPRCRKREEFTARKKSCGEFKAR